MVAVDGICDIYLNLKIYQIGTNLIIFRHDDRVVWTINFHVHTNPFHRLLGIRPVRKVLQRLVFACREMLG